MSIFKRSFPLYVWTLFSVSSLILFLSLTKPSEDSFSLSFVPLVLFGLSLYSSCLTFLKYIFRVPISRGTMVAASSVSATGVLVVMFSALGQLEAFDVILLISLISLSVFYFSRTWPK